MNRVVNKYYKEQFGWMELQGILDQLNEILLATLHFVFLPKIEKSLAEFTMNNMSPLALKLQTTLLFWKACSAEPRAVANACYGKRNEKRRLKLWCR